MTGVTFALDLPPRRPAVPEFDAPPLQAPMAGEERRHGELLLALQQIAEVVADLPEPVPPAGAPVGPDPGLLVAQALLLDDVKAALDSQASLTAQGLQAVVDRLATLGKQIVGFASGGSSASATTDHVTVDGGQLSLSAPVDLSATTLAALETINVGNFPGSQAVTGPLTDAQLRATPVPVSVSGGASETTLLDVKRAVTDMESRMDYGARTDGNPEYLGKNLQGTATSASSWVVQKFSYDASSRPTRVQVLTGVWNDRATLGWT